MSTFQRTIVWYVTKVRGVGLSSAAGVENILGLARLAKLRHAEGQTLAESQNIVRRNPTNFLVKP